jgi:outer membrane receptor protein involved in Fe transport
MPLFRRRINLAVGGNVHTASTEDFAIAGSLSPGVSVPTVFNVICNSTTNCSNGSQSTSHQSTYGWYVEPQLALNSRFFAAPGFRLDGGSGGSRSSGSFAGLSGFPKMDFSYVAVDREDGDPLWGILTLLRPRLAFGLAGTQPRAQDKLRLYNVGAYNVTTPGQGSLISRGAGGCIPTVAIEGTDSVPAVCLNSLGNTQLRPERSSEIEGGFDATLWRNRVSLTVTQYSKTRHDAILAIPVAPSVFGYQTFNAAFQIQKNIGVIRNTGTEITANAQLLQRRALGWSIGANLSNDKNVVVQLNKGQNPIVIQGIGGSAVQERVQAGFPLFGVFTRSIAGFADANQDQIIEPNEIVYGDSAVYLGEPNPKYQFNLTSDVALLEGRLTVHTGFAYQNGMTQINTGGCTSGALPLLMNQPGVSLATQAGIVAADCGGGLALSNLRDAGLGSSAIGLVQRVNTFRFNELSINYTIPRVVAQWFRAPRMSVALQGSNLALHTNYRGFDPNVNAFSTVSAVDATADNGQIPEPRTWWLRLTLGN